jgi:cbb3-type cytochrome oxidase maturation protein
MMAISLPILFVLVPVALLLAGLGVYGFLWAVRSGQYEDVDTPALRLLLEDEETSSAPEHLTNDEKPKRVASGTEPHVSSNS